MGALSTSRRLAVAVRDLGGAFRGTAASAPTGVDTKAAPARTGPDLSLGEQLAKAARSQNLGPFVKELRKQLGLPPA